jgi:hypothetical protein
MATKFTIIDGSTEGRRGIVRAARPDMDDKAVEWVADNFDVITNNLVFDWYFEQDPTTEDTGLSPKRFGAIPFKVDLRLSLRDLFPARSLIFVPDTVKVFYSLDRAKGPDTVWFACVVDPLFKVRRRAERLGSVLT